MDYERSKATNFQQYQDPLSECFKRLNIHSNQEDNPFVITNMISKINLQDRPLPTKQSDTEFAMAIMSRDVSKLEPSIAALSWSLQQKGHEISEFLVSPEFLEYLYCVLVNNTNNRVQSQVLNIFASLSSQRRSISDRLMIIPIIDRAFDLIQCSKDIQISKDAFRIVGNVLANAREPTLELFVRTEELLRTITQNWQNLSLVDYATWTLCNIWSFKNNVKDMVRVFLSTRNNTLMHIISRVVELFCGNVRQKGMTLWVCCVFLDMALTATKDYKIFKETRLLSCLLEIIACTDNDQRLRFAGLGLICHLSTQSSGYIQEIINSGLLQLVNRSLLVEISSQRIVTRTCMVLANMCAENMQQCRVVLSIPNLVGRIIQYLTQSSLSLKDKVQFSRILCNPISTLQVSDLIIYLTQFPVLQTLLEFVLSYSNKSLSETDIKIGIMDSIDIGVRRMLEYRVFSSEVMRLLKDISVTLYMLAVCGGDNTHEENKKAAATLELIRRQNNKRA